jgi:hypothetical protein
MDQPNQRSNLVKSTSPAVTAGTRTQPGEVTLPFTSLLSRRVRWAARQLRRGPTTRQAKAAPAGGPKSS